MAIVINGFSLAAELHDAIRAAVNLLCKYFMYFTDVPSFNQISLSRALSQIFPCGFVYKNSNRYNQLWFILAYNKTFAQWDLS